LAVAEQHYVYSGLDRILVEVLVDGTWYPGELRSWDLVEDGTWSGMVEWTTEPGSTYLGRVPGTMIRPV
jgi:hypothetical protein